MTKLNFIKYRLLILAVIIICFFSILNQQNNAQEKKKGEINWVGGYISAVGQGTATPSGNKIKDQLRATRAATVLAQRALLETIKGIKIDSETKVGDRFLKDDMIRSGVEGIVKGAEIVKQEVRWEGNTPVATVEMRICISNEGTGCTSNKSIITALDLGHKDEPVYAPRQRLDDILAKQVTPIITIQSPAYDSRTPVTGIIFNLLGMPYERTSLPVVITVGDRNKEFTVYSVKSVDPEIIRTYGVTRYADSVDQAKQNPYLGDNPMIVSVSQIIRENMIVISFDAARVIRETTLHGNNYLNNAKVIISAR